MRTHAGSESAYQVLVVKPPVDWAYQKTGYDPRPMGRIAPRSLRETERMRVCGSAAAIQSASVVPWNRTGAAPFPSASTSGDVVVFTPALLLAIPVE